MSKSREIDLGEGRVLQVLEGTASWIRPMGNPSQVRSLFAIPSSSFLTGETFARIPSPKPQAPHPSTSVGRNKRVMKLRSGTSIPGMALISPPAPHSQAPSSLSSLFSFFFLDGVLLGAWVWDASIVMAMWFTTWPPDPSKTSAWWS